MVISRTNPWCSKFTRDKTWIGVAFLVALSLDGQVDQGQPKRTFTHERDVQTYSVWQEMPRWDGGLLVGITGNHSKGPVIYAIDREGRRDETLFTLKDASLISVFEVAASASGELAVVGDVLAHDAPEGTTFVARISADRKSQIVTRVWPYCPGVVTFAPDGTIWTVGHLSDEENTRTLARNVLRHFDSSGKMLGSTIVNVKGWQTAETSYLHASRDRVGWFTLNNEYLEFSPTGRNWSRYNGPDGATAREISGVVLGEENEVVAGWFGKGKAELVMLDRATRKWIPVSLSTGVPEPGRVLGFDGTILVITTDNRSLRRYTTK